MKIWVDSRTQRVAAHLPRKIAIPEDLGTRSVSLLAVDDNPVCLRAVEVLVESVPGVSLAGVAKSGELAVEWVTSNAPDIVLMDVRMNGIGGIEAARRIAETHRRTRVVLITAEDERSLPSAAQCPGATAILSKHGLRPATIADLRDLVLTDAVGMDGGAPAGCEVEEMDAVG